jgi:hypothetical protein
MGDLSTAISTINNAVVKGTSEKQLCAWCRFQAYLQSIGIIGDPFLDNFDRGQKHKIAFYQKVDLVLSLPSFSSLSQSIPPWIARHRPSSWLSEQIQGSTQMDSLLSSYNDSFKDINLLIQEKPLR